MTDVFASSSTSAPAALGRPAITQSLQRGLARFLIDLSFAPLFEFELPNRRRADALGLGVKGEFWLFEIKSGPEDFRADHKWRDYQGYCDQFFFVTPPDFPPDLMPAEPGWIAADPFGAGLLRPSPLTPLAPARRKALTLAFARAAALRRRIAPPPIR